MDKKRVLLELAGVNYVCERLFLKEMQQIKLNEVLSEVNKANAVFDLKFRKVDGSISIKKGCMLRATNNPLTERRKMNRNGTLKLYIPAKAESREAYIDLLVELNGMRIIRPIE